MDAKDKADFDAAQDELVRLKASPEWTEAGRRVKTAAQDVWTVVKPALAAAGEEGFELLLEFVAESLKAELSERFARK